MNEELDRAEMPQEVPTPTMECEEYRPSKQEALKRYEINIRFLDRGCVVTVGCKEIAFQHVPDAMAALNDYVKNPYGEQQRWRKLLD